MVVRVSLSCECHLRLCCHCDTSGSVGFLTIVTVTVTGYNRTKCQPALTHCHGSCCRSVKGACMIKSLSCLLHYTDIMLCKPGLQINFGAVFDLHRLSLP